MALMHHFIFYLTKEKSSLWLQGLSLRNPWGYSFSFTVFKKKILFSGICFSKKILLGLYSWGTYYSFLWWPLFASAL